MRAALGLLFHTALRVSEVANIERRWVRGDMLVITRDAMKGKKPMRGTTSCRCHDRRGRRCGPQ